jgi:hypothetical protein
LQQLGELADELILIALKFLTAKSR